MEEVLEKHRMELAKVRLQYGSHNVMSGQYITAHAQVLLEQIRRLAEARMDSLIKAYEKAGLPLDDAAFNEIKDEVMQFCHQKQHNAVHAIGEMIKQTFHGSPPAGLTTA